MAIDETQLSFTVGGSMPTKSRARIAGGLFTHREIEKGEELHMQLVDSDGTIVADGYGRVESITFKDVYDKDGELAEVQRVHGVKIT